LLARIVIVLPFVWDALPGRVTERFQTLSRRSRRWQRPCGLVD